jgi:hypothetical protein
MTSHDEAGVETQIAEWRSYVERRREVSSPDTDELEDHLRNRIAELTAAGLEPDEAFLVAVKRIGSLDTLTREFAREHSGRLWKQLVLTPDRAAPGLDAGSRSLRLAVGCAVLAVVAVQLPRLAGRTLEDDYGFYVRNFGLFALVPLAAYFLAQRGARTPVVTGVAALFGVAVVAANAYGLVTDGSAAVLTAIHLPMALWLVVGVAYADGAWRSDQRRMDFIRFTGEWFVYYVLLALGGGVLAALTMGTFAAIDVDASTFVATWLLPSGAMGAVVLAAWLVEEKQAVIENIAPVLTWVFTPLFLAALTAFLVGAAVTGNGVGIERDLLILFDLMLVVVVGLLLYGISARDDARPANWFDRAQLGLVVAALAVDLLVLVAVCTRIGDFGFSANKTAALGENLILMTNLAGSAWILLGYLRRRGPFAPVDRWQTAILVVYAVWALLVVLVFPLVFGSD